MNLTITDRYELSGINKDFSNYIHSRLALINNDDSEFWARLDIASAKERIEVINDKIFQVKIASLIFGKTLDDKEALEALSELKERIKHRAKL